MVLNNLNEPVFTSKDLIKEIYRGNLSKINLAKVDYNDIEFMSLVEFVSDNNLDWPLPEPYFSDTRTKENLDSEYQSKWVMSEEYKNLNIRDYLLSLCVTDIEKNRVNLELDLFEKYKMTVVLQFLKYLVDKLRKEKILWGVGRGSSVASYCLYLLGIHKVDSIKYNLDIREFLR